MNRKILLIDDEIRSNRIIDKGVEKYHIDDNFNLSKIEARTEALFPDTHADKCSKIIFKYVKEKVLLVNFVIKGEDDGRLDKFLCALYYASIFDFNVINISVGITKKISLNRMHTYIKKIVSRNSRIVAAYDNASKNTFPASFNEVIGCIADENAINYYQLNNKYYLKGCHCIRDNYGKVVFTSSSNSFAAAYMTSFLINQR